MARSTARAAVMQMIFENLAGGEGGEETLQMVYEALREEGVPGVAEIGEKGTVNEHSMRDMIVNIPWLGAVEFGESAFRFVRRYAGIVLLSAAVQHRMRFPVISAACAARSIHSGRASKTPGTVCAHFISAAERRRYWMRTVLRHFATVCAPRSTCLRAMSLLWKPDVPTR